MEVAVALDASAPGVEYVDENSERRRGATRLESGKTPPRGDPQVCKCRSHVDIAGVRGRLTGLCARV